MDHRDQHATNTRYYAAHRTMEIDRVRRRQVARTAILRLLRMRPCADCGERFLPHQMDFDHRDPSTKAFRISSGGGTLASTARLAAEIAKCDIICANCHRIRTQRWWAEGRAGAGLSTDPATERKRRRWRAHAAVLDALRDVPCQECGGRFPPCAMDFDHRDPAAKRSGVTRMIGRAGLDAILKEVDGCDIVCANCHRDRTKRRRGGRSTERE